MGKRNLELAAREASIPIQVQWEPFFLSTDTPKEGIEISEYLAMKYGSQNMAQMSKRMEHLNEAGRAVGINFTKSRLVVPTIDAHRLMEWCNTQQSAAKGDELMENIFKKYFEQGKNISNKEILLDAIREVGLDVSAADKMLSSNEFTSDVISKDRSVKGGRISGVPFFILSNDNVKSKPITFSGAQV